jgi:hypothetical protein
MGLGENDKALDSLEQAVKERAPGVVHLKVSPVFIELRSTKRFQKLLSDMGLAGGKQTALARRPNRGKQTSGYQA